MAAWTIYLRLLWLMVKLPGNWPTCCCCAAMYKLCEMSTTWRQWHVLTSTNKWAHSQIIIMAESKCLL